MTTWLVIVPFCLAALLTGLVQSSGTTWGLFRHYWVAIKLVLTVLATIILLLHTQPIDQIAAIAAQTTLSSDDFRQLRLQLVGDAAAAIFVLLMTTTLSIYKPWGLTPYGVRKQYEAAPTWQPVARRSTTMGRQVLFGIGALCSLPSFGTFSAKVCMVTEYRSLSRGVLLKCIAASRAIRSVHHFA